MAQKEITQEQKLKLLKFFATKFENTGMHSILTKLMLVLILSLIGTTFYAIWGSSSIGFKLLLTEAIIFLITCAAHSIIETSYKNLWQVYIKEYPDVYQEYENGLIQKIKDNNQKQKSKWQKKVDEAIKAREEK